MSVVDSLVQGLLSNSSARVRTRVSPEVSLELIGEGGQPPAWVQLLKPSIDLYSGSQLVAHLAPAGEPEPDMWLLVAGVLVVVLVVIVVAVFS